MVTASIRGMPVTNCDGLFQAICSLKDIGGYSFHKMAVMSDFRGMPAGTICAVYHGKPLPKKWREAFGFPVMLPAPACAKCGKVHTTARCTEGRTAGRRWVRCAGHAGGGWE